MRATVNFEFDTKELESFASTALSRSIVRAFGSADPAQLQGLLTSLHQGIGAVLGQAAAVRQHHGPPPPWARAYAAPAPGPIGTHGPYAGPYAGPAYPGPMGGPPQQEPGNVRPIRQPAAVERCFTIDGSRSIEPGWGCHLCATYNGEQRGVCRSCGHTRCDPIVTPPPDQQSLEPSPVPGSEP